MPQGRERLLRGLVCSEDISQAELIKTKPKKCVSGKLSWFQDMCFESFLLRWMSVEVTVSCHIGNSHLVAS